MKNKLTVIIPNYNSIKYIRECLDSLRGQSLKEYELVVVDNASTDGSDKVIEEEYKEARLIRMTQNFGFSHAVNEGIKLANSEYIVLLNDDIKVDSELLSKLYQAIEADSAIFSVSAKMVQLHNTNKLDGAGDLYSALGWAYARGKDHNRDSKRFNKRCRVFSSCGGAAVYRKAILDEIGYFDEYYFAYLEDVDMGYRARIHGYINVYEPSALVYHAGSAVSGSRYNDFKVRISARNNIYLVFKNMPVLQIILNLPFLLIGFGIKGIFFILKGFGRPYFSGLLRGYLLCTEGRKTRYDRQNLKNYVRIQLELWANMFRRV